MGLSQDALRLDKAADSEADTSHLIGKIIQSNAQNIAMDRNDHRAVQ